MRMKIKHEGYTYLTRDKSIFNKINPDLLGLLNQFAAKKDLIPTLYYYLQDLLKCSKNAAYFKKQQEAHRQKISALNNERKSDRKQLLDRLERIVTEYLNVHDDRAIFPPPEIFTKDTTVKNITRKRHILRKHYDREQLIQMFMLKKPDMSVNWACTLIKDMFKIMGIKRRDGEDYTIDTIRSPVRNWKKKSYHIISLDPYIKAYSSTGNFSPK